MQSSSVTSKPRRVDLSRRTNTSAGPKARANGFQREDKNMNTITASSQRQVTKAPTAPFRTKPGIQPRASTIQSRLSSQKPGSSFSKAAKPKPKGACAVTANKSAAAAPPPPPNVLPLDPNCNEPSLPCLCCDGRSPQDNNSMFNHNHNNNNTISLKQQLQLPPPPAQLALKHDGKGAKEQALSQAQVQMDHPASDLGGADKSADENASVNVENKEKVKQNEEVNNIDTDSDEDFEDDDDDDDSEDDDTLVPSSCDCPPSFLDFSLSSSTSSSSTSISSCSDLESDCTNPCSSICSTEDQDNLSLAYSLKEHSFTQATECQPPSRSPPSRPVSQNPFSFKSKVALCSPDEGYPSALDSPSPDYLGVKGDSESVKLDLLDFLESVGEFGKMERFSQVIQVARWDLEGEQHWDVLRHRLDHLDRLEKVNREVKLAYIARLHDKGYDLGDLDEQNLTDIMDEMGNIDVSWRLYKAPGGTMTESQEFSDAGVDLTALSDIDEPFLPDSLPSSPTDPPPRPPKPPARHESVNSDLHTYINISRETTSMAVTTSPTLSTFSPNSPTFTTFRCEKPLLPSPPSIPPLPASKPVPYLSLYTTPSPPPSAPTPTPPIPPPRRRHLARKEAQRLAALQAEQEKTPLSLPPPTSRPPPLPPPPVISITSSPPTIPPPPSLPPPPSFHALDVEIRKLLMLAGLTQAELLKLSPELGVCVGGLEDEQEEVQEFRLQDKDKTLGESRTRNSDEESEEASIKEENKDKHRTTTFTEMARRRKKTSDLYYQTPVNNIHENVSRNTNIKSFHYPPELVDSPPPPPPPRPLPPIPPSLPPVKVSTLPANSKQPERFDWLIAFTPECEAPANQTKAHADTLKKSSSSGSPGSAPKVTTFKELRFRNKNTSPPTKLITEPDPDPTVITPDPDILYNLKWRKEKAGSDGSQWEYTSQAQALFMQPPPALTSMAALQEMLQRADKEGGQLELCPSPKIVFSVSDNNLLSTGRQLEKREVKHEDKDEGRKELEVRGRADGGRTVESRTSAVRSISFGGSVQKAETLWMGEDVKYLLRGDLSSQCLQEKKALVSAVSVAVEAILAQFSSSRTVVQKTLSGDSTINPSLGRLVLQCLCPALHGLLVDGLKPHQSDLIAGRRPNSAWSLVSATTRPAPKTQALYNLQVRVSELPQLKQSKHRFNAFILGLLNIKHLDFWLSHLQSCSDVLETYYYPTSFMRLSVTACQPLFKELLLVLQPLSLLTFNVDLLFQHHHIEADAHRPQIPSVREDGFQSHSKTRSYRHTGSLSGVDFGSLETKDTKADVETTDSGTSAEASHTSPQLLWVQKKQIEDLPPPNIYEDSFTQQAGQVIQQGWGAMMRWGGKLSQNLADLSLTSVKKEEMNADLPDVQPGGDYAPVSGGAQVPWGLGRLFGASKSPNSPTGHTAPTRRPSQWLAPGVTAFTRMVSSSSTPMLRRTPEPLEERHPTPERDGDTQEKQDKPRPLRSVRALCDHTGNGSELSFCKGEELVVLGGVDQDWIRCRQGDREGLVPIGYTSLIM